MDSTIKEEIKEKVKEDIILSFDPGFKKMGVALITTKTGDYVESYTVAVRPEAKLNQSQVDGYISKNIKNLMKSIYD